MQGTHIIYDKVHYVKETGTPYAPNTNTITRGAYTITVPDSFRFANGTYKKYARAIIDRVFAQLEEGEEVGEQFRTKRSA